MDDSIQRDITIDAPVERVWAAITEPRHVGVWFGTGQPAKMDFRPGGGIVFSHGEAGETLATIERIEPQRLFAYRWALVGARDVPPGDGNATLVEFTLEPDGDATRLTVTETGFTKLTAVDVEARAKQYGDNVGGWAQKVVELADYIATMRP